MREVIQFTANPSNRPFWVFQSQFCVDITNDVFSGKSYPLRDFFGEINTIVDVGANIGAATVYFKTFYPEARALAFEPDPEAFELLKRNTEGLGVECFQCGLSDIAHKAQLFLGTINDSITNSIHKSPMNGAESVPVEIRAAREAIGGYDIDLLKLDTEGCEVQILQSIRDRLPGIAVVYVEYHSDDDRLEIDRLLSPSHYLLNARAGSIHCGELCYLSKAKTPEWAAQKIERWCEHNY